MWTCRRRCVGGLPGRARYRGLVGMAGLSTSMVVGIGVFCRVWCMSTRGVVCRICGHVELLDGVIILAALGDSTVASSLV